MVGVGALNHPPFSAPENVPTKEVRIRLNYARNTLSPIPVLWFIPIRMFAK